MSGRLTIDLLIDRLKSIHVPAPKGASMRPYDPEADRDALSGLLAAYNNCWRACDFQTDNDRSRLADAITGRAGRSAGLDQASPLFRSFAIATHDMMASEPAYLPFSKRFDISALSPLEVGELSNNLSHRIRFLTDTATQDAARATLDDILSSLLKAMPSSVMDMQAHGTQALTTDFLSLVDKPYDFMTSLLARFIGNDDAQHRGLFLPLSRQLYRNILEASGVVVDPDQPLFSHELKKPKLPEHCMADSALEVAVRYFANTPLLDLLKSQIAISIPEVTRFEHTHILAGTGHGKTQLLQHMIVSDLSRAPSDVPSMVILDSQGDMLDKLKNLSLFDPTVPGSLADRFLIVDPSDIEWAPALNMFDFQSTRIGTMSRRDQERMRAGLIQIYDYIFASIVGAELSSKMTTLFRSVVGLLMVIPGADIRTLLAILEDITPYAKYIDELDGLKQDFFKKHYNARAYNATKEQIIQRLHGFLDNPTFARMFARRENRLDLFEILNDGGIVLVDTSKSFMTDEPSAMFGRYIIALTLRAAMERANIPEDKRKPTFLYVDEAHEYFDENIDKLLVQARKYNLGLVMAHQSLAQLKGKGKLSNTMLSQPAIKLAGTDDITDAKALAANMRTSPQFLMSMKKSDRVETEFAAFVRGLTPQAIKLTIPLGSVEKMDRMSGESFEILLNASRRRLSAQPVKPTEVPSKPDAPTKHASTPPSPSDNDDFWEEG